MAALVLALSGACTSTTSGGPAITETVAEAAAPTASSEPAPSPGFFSAAQVERGRASYAEACSECHTLSEFRGSDFEWTWRRQTAWQLYSQVAETMPEDKPGQLPEVTYVDIVAYLLSLNGYQIGGSELSPEREQLEAISLGAGAAKERPQLR